MRSLGIHLHTTLVEREGPIIPIMWTLPISNRVRSNSADCWFTITIKDSNIIIEDDLLTLIEARLVRGALTQAIQEMESRIDDHNVI